MSSPTPPNTTTSPQQHLTDAIAYNTRSALAARRPGTPSNDMQQSQQDLLLQQQLTQPSIQSPSTPINQQSIPTNSQPSLSASAQKDLSDYYAQMTPIPGHGMDTTANISVIHPNNMQNVITSSTSISSTTPSFHSYDVQPDRHVPKPPPQLVATPSAQPAITAYQHLSDTLQQQEFNTMSFNVGKLQNRISAIENRFTSVDSKLDNLIIRLIPGNNNFIVPPLQTDVTTIHGNHAPQAPISTLPSNPFPEPHRIQPKLDGIQSSTLPPHARFATVSGTKSENILPNYDHKTNQPRHS